MLMDLTALFFLLPAADMCHLCHSETLQHLSAVNDLSVTAREAEGQRTRGQKQSGKQAAVNVFWNRSFRSLASMCETRLPYF